MPLAVAEYAVAIAAFWAISIGTNEATRRLGLPVPSNALAMLVTFALLMSGLVPLRILEGGAALLVRHLALFFVPLAVGIIELKSMNTLLLPLTAVIMTSVGAGLVVAALTASAVRSRDVSTHQ